MKYKVLAALLWSLGWLQINAQVTVKPGVRAGMNLATISNMNADMKADFYVGGFVSIKFTSFYTLQPELTYSRQGAKSGLYDFRGDDPIVIDPQMYPRFRNIELQYLSVGAMNKFRIAAGLHAVVGPTLDFKVGDNFTRFYDDPIGVDMAIVAGFGYTFPFGLTVEARYKQGLIDIFGNDYDDDFYSNNSYYENNVLKQIKLNQVIQLGAAYSFDF